MSAVHPELGPVSSNQGYDFSVSRDFEDLPPRPNNVFSLGRLVAPISAPRITSSMTRRSRHHKARTPQI
jgi:hypothetical protein